MKTPDTKAAIVMVTNHDQAGLREAALHAGAYAFVAKDNVCTCSNATILKAGSNGVSEEYCAREAACAISSVHPQRLSV